MVLKIKSLFCCYHLRQEADRELGQNHMRLLKKRLKEQITRASSATIPQVVSVLDVFSQTGEKDSLRRQLESEPNVWGNPGHQTSKRLQLWCLLVLLCYCTCMEIAIRCPKISTKMFRPSALLN